MSKRGLFITFEGGEGAGKSTQIAMLASLLEHAGVRCRVVREPGGTVVGEQVRAILLDPETGWMDARAELLLYEAARAQLVAEVIEPALDAGEVVICDRFYDSTVAYQGYARGLRLEEVEAANSIATTGLAPDRTLLLDLDVETGMDRATTDGADRLEAEERAFHDRVRHGFLVIAQREPERVRVVDAMGAPEAVFARVCEALENLPTVGPAVSGR